MLEEKKETAPKDADKSKSSCNTQSSSSCGQEDKEKDVKKSGMQAEEKKENVQPTSGHKHGGSCSH